MVGRGGKPLFSLRTIVYQLAPSGEKPQACLPAKKYYAKS